MKYSNNINIRVFCKEEENEEKIKEGLLKIINFSEEELKKEKLEIKKTKAKGFEDKKIIIYELNTEKERHNNKILRNLKEKLSKADKTLIKKADRLDDNLDLFIRLLKPSVLENFFELTDSGDCYHIKINIASFPKNKENAKKKIQTILE